MKTEIVMPKMGESLQEGTVLKWLKKIGDKIERGRFILEISTDKVDTEVPSPVSGIIVELLAAENETVEVGKVIAYIETDEASASNIKPKEAEMPPRKEEKATVVAFESSKTKRSEER
ncbi:MAG: hypothetical protein M1419_08955, partial [Bacteroidetes bacterium]|nr:hypothetical protein [Bacteroidota bacterium]